MEEWFLQRLPFVQSRLHIPLQAPVVVGQIFNIASPSREFLHITDILVKALILFSTEVSTVFWKIVQMRPEEVHFHLYARTNLVEVFH